MNTIRALANSAKFYATPSRFLRFNSQAFPKVINSRIGKLSELKVIAKFGDFVDGAVTDREFRLVRDGFFGEVLAKGNTNSDGEVVLEYDPEKLGSASIQVLEDPQPFTGLAHKVITGIWTLEGLPTNSGFAECPLSLNYYNQSPDLSKVSIRPGHTQSWGYVGALAKASFPEGLKGGLCIIATVISNLFLKNFISSTTVKKIFASVGPQPTLKVLNGDTITKEYLNGLFSNIEHRKTEKGIAWDIECKEEKDIDNSLPRKTTFEAVYDEKGYLKEHEITVIFDKNIEIVKPYDEKYPWALLINSSSAVVKAEGEDHLGLHIANGVFANEFFKCFPKGPIYNGLAWCIGGTNSINTQGKWVIFGLDSILGGTALSEHGSLEAVLKGAIKHANWLAPDPEMLTPDHDYAHDMQLIGRIFKEFFTEYYLQHEDIVKSQWDKVFDMSKVIEELLKGGFPPITTTKVYSREGLNNLILFSARVAQMATVQHSGLHNNQNIIPSTLLTPRGRALDANGEFVEHGNENPFVTIYNLVTGYSLLNFNYKKGGLFANDFNDIPKALHEKLVANKQNFRCVQKVRKSIDI